MQQRYYDPVAGRFLSVDPVSADPDSGGNFNRFSYANNSPYNYIDPDGREAEPTCGSVTPCVVNIPGKRPPNDGGWSVAISMTSDWVTNSGPAVRNFDANSTSTQNMMHARRVNEARKAWYKKNQKLFAAKKPLAALTNYRGDFGIFDFIWYAGFNPTQQFVGSYRIDISPMDGDHIKFELSNNSSLKSFLYGHGPEGERDEWSHFGNMRQTYTWTEEIKK